MAKSSVDFDFLFLTLLILWQVAFLWTIIRRSPRIGIIAAISVSGIVAAMGWAGASLSVALVVTVLSSIAITAPIVLEGPAKFRAAVGSFCVGGLAIVSALWISRGLTQWRMLAVVTLLTTMIVTGFYFILGLDRPTRVAHNLSGPSSPPHMKYWYFSRRAIDALYQDNGERSRFSLAVKELRLPSLANITPEVTFTLRSRTAARHAVAGAVEDAFGRYINEDPTVVAAAESGMLRGCSDVWQTLYGSEKIEEQLPHKERVAFLTTTGKGNRTAVCLFGSKDNLDGVPQDSHPDPVTGWALSSTSAVIEWLNDSSVEWRSRRWGETIGFEALKMANYQAIMDVSGFGGERSKYARSLAARYPRVEWAALIYHVEKVDSERIRIASLPFDTIMIGRPFWIRSRHLAFQGTDEYTLDMLKSSQAGHPASDRWKAWLQPDESNPDWTLFLYRALCRIRGIDHGFGMDGTTRES